MRWTSPARLAPFDIPPGEAHRAKLCVTTRLGVDLVEGIDQTVLDQFF